MSITSSSQQPSAVDAVVITTLQIEQTLGHRETSELPPRSIVSLDDFTEEFLLLQYDLLASP